MKLIDTLDIADNMRIAIVGSGGKTTLMFRLAAELGSNVIVTTTTHLSREQAGWGNQEFIISGEIDIAPVLEKVSGVCVLHSGYTDDGKVSGLSESSMKKLLEISKIPVIIEADGAKCKPLKAPAEHEPLIPSLVDAVIVVAGLAGIDKPLSDQWVHRKEIFSRIAHLELNGEIEPDHLLRLLQSPLGGLKNIPLNAKKIALLNQADDEVKASIGGEIAEKLTRVYDAVLVSHLASRESKAEVRACYEPVAAIIMAAGESKRLGRPKQLAKWHGMSMIRHLAKVVIASGVYKVVVVVGAYGEDVCDALTGLPVEIIRNDNWKDGQSTSIKAGLGYVAGHVGAAFFLPCDQPFITEHLLRSMVERRRTSRPLIVAPEVEGRRISPVLFDQRLFGELNNLSGDIGGKVLFNKFAVNSLVWNDERLLLDLDSETDYPILLNADSE